MTGRPLILYVEDDVDTFTLAQLRLATRYELISATTDVEACAAFERHGSRLYAVLTDIELQGSQLDGLALVRLLRGLPPGRALPDFARAVRPLPNVPVIVLTAYATKYSEADIKALGASQFLVKPIDFTRLSLALAQASIHSVMQHLSTSTRPD